MRLNLKLCKSAKEQELDNAAELNQFLAQVERRAFRMAMYAVAETEDALDIVQEAMLVFVRNYRNRPAAEWQVLFQRTLQSRITDSHRRAVVRNRFRTWFGLGSREDDDSDPIEGLPDIDGQSPADLLEREGLGKAIGEAVAALPLRQQQAFLLRSWEGLDVAETASAMGCSEGSVKTHHFRAVRTLRELLKEYWP
ncbi:RNA polymerase sigma factor [Geobacter argillaceus]|uniref:RNA polymerase sigma-70 factor (ECF subfamily) n=1 Tax=Geobacter argillaceus TaxID=345631 RepID=A0A562WR17_9BACT|nr:RNA polymerase sigma factor [Geobacter argillaceus]TWJ32678.1 RNA polymerase sigma-70 factor (ECF subfamily) [Geobacter argillaceus]